MQKYQVTWGADSAVVDAANENEAWALFCQGNPVARVNPKLYERKILAVTHEPQRVLLVETATPEPLEPAELAVLLDETSLEDDING